MDKLKHITFFPVECPNCSHQNPAKEFTINCHLSDVRHRELIDKQAMRCDNCSYDIYEHNKEELKRDSKKIAVLGTIEKS